MKSACLLTQTHLSLATLSVAASVNEALKPPEEQSKG